MAVKYCVWLNTKLTGQPCTAGLPGGAPSLVFAGSATIGRLRGLPAELNLLRLSFHRVGSRGRIGANIGGFTVPMARRWLPAGRAWRLLQPSPATFRILQKNIGLNRLANVEAIQVVVADGRSVLISFTNDTACAARNRIATETAAVGDAPVVRVDAFRLDQIFAERNITRLDFVKTHTEGAETRVFRGRPGCFAIAALNLSPKYAHRPWRREWVPALANFWKLLKASGTPPSSCDPTARLAPAGGGRFGADGAGQRSSRTFMTTFPSI